ncbi:VCBS repeat-containing protein [uncultured Gimesia sp.]|uniref:FG-GAP repeat domain-containing protein n=1 Tax=uncultured Gimesia sp. TaxID=1678688 RepID=UPI0030DD8A8A|tara:strand:+ start:39930 stop:41450 length:1521 start_codon:yes stop_codon:yes gene_type:complete
MWTRLCFFLLLALPLSCEKQEPPSQQKTVLSSDARYEEFHAEIQSFCGSCHLCPDPNVLTKEFWRLQIPREYAHYEQSQHKQLRVPPMPEVIQYFVSQAPEKHALPGQIVNPLPGPVSFRKQEIQNSVANQLPGVSDLNWRPGKEGAGELLITDLGSGEIGRILFTAGKPTFQSLAKLKHPAHIERADLNQDQHDDYLIADLGSFGPEDHDRGKVTLLKFDEKTQKYQPQHLQEGLGRVADTKAADFDGDGDLDIIVAEFGWQNTGQLLYLKNVSPSISDLQFDLQVLDDRHGASHMLITDFNQDGLLDFVTLFSQEHEIIVAFINQGAGHFKKETVYQAPDPAYGSSSISLVDLDQDGNLDLLYTNGDTMDSFELRPSHSLQWLENTGSFPFRHHRIAPLTGAYCATHGDFDGDGDIDLAACTMTWDYQEPRNTIVWYEQQKPGEFIPHPLDYSHGQHAVIEAGDFDADGDLDLAVGNFEPRETDQASPAEWFSIWWNEGPVKSE